MTAPAITATSLMDRLLAEVTARAASLDHAAPIADWRVDTAADGRPWLIGSLTAHPGVPALTRMQLIEKHSAGRHTFRMAWTPDGLSLDFQTRGVWVSLLAADTAEGRCAA